MNDMLRYLFQKQSCLCADVRLPEALSCQLPSLLAHHVPKAMVFTEKCGSTDYANDKTYFRLLFGTPLLIPQKSDNMLSAKSVRAQGVCLL